MKKFLLLTSISALASLAVSQAGVVITPATGHNLTWDGNDGDYYDNVNVAGVPSNAALASLGGVPIASNPTSPHFPPHNFANINDGFYGNSYSHINGGGPDPAWMGVLLPATIQINSIAFSRDNGTPGGTTPPGGPFDCCGGQLQDRSLGLYTLQYTTDGGGSWTDIGTLNYTDDGDNAPGGTFDEFLRHQYGVSGTAGPIFGDGVRILLPNNGIAIDEIEVNTIPEPSGAALLGLGLFGLLLRRRR